MKEREMRKYTMIISLMLIIGLFPAKAQKDENKGIIWSSLRGLEYTIKGGFNIGGTSPIPLPREIRSIDSYNPTLCVSIEGDIKKWFDTQKKWGMMIGLKLETKGMKTKATTKNYSMEIIASGGETMKGSWTGGVQTKVSLSDFTIPLVALYQLSNRVSLSAGPYISITINKEFAGYVYEGYLREIDPTGEKVEFSGDSQAPYDFSDDLRSFQWGVRIGAEWKAFKHLIVYGDLSWGLNDIFKSDFETITFAMYPIYLNIGFGYAF